jgi:hypothetical protein
MQDGGNNNSREKIALRGFINGSRQPYQLGDQKVTEMVRICGTQGKMTVLLFSENLYRA